MACNRGCCATERDHIHSISISGFPHKHTLTERQWDRDMPAYKLLRSQGLQPRDIDGCADVAVRATIPHEIETGQVLPPKEAQHTSSVLADMEH